MESISTHTKVQHLAERVIWAALGLLHELDDLLHLAIDWLLGIADERRRRS